MCTDGSSAMPSCRLTPVGGPGCLSAGLPHGVSPSRFGGLHSPDRGFFYCEFISPSELSPMWAGGPTAGSPVLPTGRLFSRCGSGLCVPSGTTARVGVCRDHGAWHGRCHFACVGSGTYERVGVLVSPYAPGWWAACLSRPCGAYEKKGKKDTKDRAAGSPPSSHIGHRFGELL